MMQLPTILAHGALGAFDELIYVSIAVLFVVIMAISWLRSRSADVDEDDTPETPEARTPDTADHVRLD